MAVNKINNTQYKYNQQGRVKKLINTITAG